MLWKIVKMMIDANTLKKISILGQKDVLKGLLEYIDIDQIPIYYGGNLSYSDPSNPDAPHIQDSCRWYSPEVLNMNDWVDRINKNRDPSLDPSLPRPHGGSGVQEALPIPGSDAYKFAMTHPRCSYEEFMAKSRSMVVGSGLSIDIPVADNEVSPENDGTVSASGNASMTSPLTPIRSTLLQNTSPISGLVTPYHGSGLSSEFPHANFTDNFSVTSNLTPITTPKRRGSVIPNTL